MNKEELAKKCNDFHTGHPTHLSLPGDKVQHNVVETMQEVTTEASSDKSSNVIIVKQRANKEPMTSEQLQQFVKAMNNKSATTSAFIDPPLLTTEQIMEKKKVQLQKNASERRIRKATKNKALSIVTSKNARRRVVLGATVKELQTEVEVTTKRARTLRREAVRNMEKLSRKFSTKQAQPSQIV